MAWFRIANRSWGGDPRKTLSDRKYDGIINPRESFDTWTETVQGRSEPSAEYEMKGIEILKEIVFDSVISKQSLLAELLERLSRK